MSWYRTGSIAVTTGSAVVNGAGTDWVANVAVGDALLGPDLRVYEIGAVVSATVLTLVGVYAGPGAGGQPYAILPTHSSISQLALAASELLGSFGAVRDGPGQGLFGGGSAALPGIRFAADQDTGLFSRSPNVIGLSTGGRRSYELAANAFSIFSDVNDRNMTGGDRIYAAMTFASFDGVQVASIRAVQQNTEFQDAGSLTFHTSYGASPERMRLDSAGSLLVGVTSGNRHVISKGSVQGTGVLDIVKACSVFVGDNVAFSQASASFWITADTRTNRSMNAAGTINASGADYAEYMTKATGCGTIAAGDVCGVDLDGRLTCTWADAVSFVVKSTDPAYVGGDSWAQHLPPRPEAPGAEPQAPIAPGAPPEDDAALADWRAVAATYSGHVAAYQLAHAEWQDATDDHARDLAAWEAALEAERVKVDRIAFCGQVPVNVTGDFAVGDYLIAAAAGAGIKAVAVPEADITFDQYRRRLGKVWAVRDGRAWVDVQHG